MTTLTLLVLLSCFSMRHGMAVDTITSSKVIKDPETITSNTSTYQLGFFSPANSTDRFVGIWFANRGIGPAETVIWVANRNKPLKELSSGMLTISEDGNLVLLNGKEEILWSSNIKTPVANTTAKLLDSGNLVLLDNSNGNTIWESFQQPSNTFMPKMKLSTNLRTGEKVQLTSWKSSSDPSVGSFACGVDPSNIPEVFIWNNSQPYWRSGPWNNRVLTGIQDMSSVYLDGFNIVDDKEGSVYITYSFANESFLAYIILNPQGKIEEHVWDYEEEEWVTKWVHPKTECDIYGKCGLFGVCDSQKPSSCSCLRGFEPKNKEEWNKGNWSGGCVRSTPLGCRVGKEDGFLKLEKMKVPDFSEWSSSNHEVSCRNSCLSNCSCTAYAFDAGIGCMSWSGDLIDTQKFSRNGVDLYIRLPDSELDKKKDKKTIIVIAAVIAGVLMIAVCTLLKLMPKYTAATKISKNKEMELFNRTTDDHALSDEINEVKLQELPLFRFEELATATNNFHLANKLGQGGFGPVYRGMLQNGQGIAVKRLSKSSGQGLQEFTNEVLVISKLQHRNLVRLLGCCVEEGEKMLVYEYMPNKSLDALLFKPLGQEKLDWRKRFNIIEGISRGLLYLHRDSRLRIIHRDLKASNILLDEELNPKISDFGMARIFGGNEDQANTGRVVGTYGYMAPEYAMEGRFSEKSDVFSFGVLLLEIVSGKKNTSFHNNEHSLSLVEHAWKLWRADNILGLVDMKNFDVCHERETLKCIHVGLLCVQEFAEDRPTISTVISLLSSETMDLPSPKQPAFTRRWIALDKKVSPNYYNTAGSVNSVTLTVFEGR